MRIVLVRVKISVVVAMNTFINELSKRKPIDRTVESTLLLVQPDCTFVV
jgi:hypothetical protein